ncbi:activator of 90 kDa heat shock protein ATPase homolog 2-like isoform X2 [Ciconia boyciana]|uniref:activator of 90 kDa heat shock protein ATPase homolog 2-like isoform X2 n=1 Tax=Ciconia boyciana TaxID=52775 RepID=UPI003BA3BCF2
MAKWGQGDPRWIVEERADATNVNNWHWTERDATGWSKSKLKEVLVGLVVEGEAGRCEISDLKHVEGEASCNSRKGKLIIFYEWNLRLSWREFTLGMILPTKAALGQELAAEQKPSGTTVQDSVSPQSLDIVGVKIPTVKILMREIFNSPAEELYSIFTTKELVQKFSKCPAVIEAEKGGKLQMFDGCVSGEYAELVPSQRIVLKWRCRNWPDEHYATVALNFKDMAAQTELQLECKGVPVSNEDSTRQCWKKQYFEEIHILLQQSQDNLE